MDKYLKWTSAYPVTDEMLLSQFGRLAVSVAHKMTRSYSMSVDDAEDVSGDIMLRLLRLPQDKRAYTGYCRMVINNAARESLNAWQSKGATPSAKWRESSTVSYADAAPSRLDDDDDGSAIERLGCIEFSFIFRKV